MARIVIADDDPDLRFLIEFRLAALGHDVTAVDNGAAVIEAFRTERPALAVLDINMPHVTGLDALREIRATPEFSDVPVILLTALAQDSDRQRGLTAGANAYMTKPFSFLELGERVNDLLGGTRG